ncbi:MAG: YigZ family protein [Roseiflexaceae bacterium]
MAHFVPTGPVHCEIRVSNSRFITHLAPASDVATARAFIANIRQQMPDANHHVYAYVIGHGGTTTLGMSDDGEPSGTAGRPALAVLKGSGLGDVVVVVTRYFGGTLLGTGGLVHAYGDSVKAVLEITEREEKIARTQLVLAMSYAQYEGIKRTLANFDHHIDDESFGTDITMTVTVRVSDVETVNAILTEQTAGQIVIIPA